MIWTDWGSAPKIEKATLSGNQRVSIVTANLKWPSGIELDRGNKRVFWVDAGMDRVESVDYEGNNRKLLKRIIGFHPFGVALIAPFLFFTDWATSSLLHTLDADTGDYVLSSYSGNGRPMGIVAYDSARQPPGIPRSLVFVFIYFCREKWGELKRLLNLRSTWKSFVVLFYQRKLGHRWGAAYVQNTVRLKPMNGWDNLIISDDMVLPNSLFPK